MARKKTKQFVVKVVQQARKEIHVAIEALNREEAVRKMIRLREDDAFEEEFNKTDITVATTDFGEPIPVVKYFSEPSPKLNITKTRKSYAD